MVASTAHSPATRECAANTLLMASAPVVQGNHRYWLRFSSGILDVTVEERVQSEHELLDGWRFVDHVEVVEDDDPGDPEIGLEPWAKGDEWRYTTLEVDAHMDGPSDRWEADRHFRDLAERVTGRRPGPGSNWSLRSSPRISRMTYRTPHSFAHRGVHTPPGTSRSSCGQARVILKLLGNDRAGDWC